MAGPITPVEVLLTRIADSLDEIVTIARGQRPPSDPGTQDPEPLVSEAPAPPRKTAAAKVATKSTASRKGR